MRRNQIIRQRGQLLHPRDSHILDPSLLTLLEELIVDLAGTQDMTLDLVGRDEGVRVLFGEVPLEDGLAFHGREVGPGERVTEEGFGEENDELEYQLCLEFYKHQIAYGFSKLALVLTAKNVEVVGGGTTMSAVPYSASSSLILT